MAGIISLASCDVHILIAGTRRVVAGTRLGMGFLVGERHVLTCAHVVSESFGERDRWRNQRRRPERPVTLALAFSNGHLDPIEAEIEAWWPEYEDVQNRTELDDLALLRLPDSFILPSDAEPARLCSDGLITHQRVSANGVTIDEQEGVNMTGRVVGMVRGNRIAIRSDGGDGTVEPGYSGAAVRSDDGVIGVMAERQQHETGLVIPVTRLIACPEIKHAAGDPQRGFVSQQSPYDTIVSQSVAGWPGEWMRMPLSARLKRQLHECNRTSVCGRIEAVALAPVAERKPALGVFGCGKDDLPTLLYDRFRSHFLVEAGHPKREVSHPPDKWTLQQIAWRDPSETAAKAFALMKKQLMRAVNADDAAPDTVRKALGAGESQAFYSEIRLEHVGPEDGVLIRLWADYLGELAGSRKSLVHLLRIEPGPDVPEAKLVRTVRNLVKKTGDNDLVLDLGILSDLNDEDLHRWLQAIADRVPLDGVALDELTERARRELLTGATPLRLRHLREWLDKLNRQDA